MKNMFYGMGLATAAAISLAIALPGSAGANSHAIGSGSLTSGLPDITISVGYIDGKKWTDPGVVTITDMGSVIATQVGPQSNMCRFNQFDYQPGNRGTVDAAVSVAKVYRDNVLVDVDHFANGYLFANGWNSFEKWPAELKEGMNTVKVVVDANNQLSESNEGNNIFVGKINVKLDCNGDGVIDGVGPTQVKPNQGGHEPVKPGSKRLRLKPRS